MKQVRCLNASMVLVVLSVSVASWFVFFFN